MPSQACFHSFLQSDIRDYSSLYKVCEGVDCIFHTASYGMSGPEQVTFPSCHHCIFSAFNRSNRSWGVDALHSFHQL